jgi:hypothetical protein
MVAIYKFILGAWKMEDGKGKNAYKEYYPINRIFKPNTTR